MWINLATRLIVLALLCATTVVLAARDVDLRDIDKEIELLTRIRSLMDAYAHERQEEGGRADEVDKKNVRRDNTVNVNRKEAKVSQNKEHFVETLKELKRKADEQRLQKKRVDAREQIHRLLDNVDKQDIEEARNLDKHGLSNTDNAERSTGGEDVEAEVEILHRIHDAITRNELEEERKRNMNNNAETGNEEQEREFLDFDDDLLNTFKFADRNYDWWVDGGNKGTEGTTKAPSTPPETPPPNTVAATTATTTTTTTAAPSGGNWSGWNWGRVRWGWSGKRKRSVRKLVARHPLED